MDINAHGFLQKDTLSYFTRGFAKREVVNNIYKKKKREVVNNVPMTYFISTVICANFAFDYYLYCFPCVCHELLIDTTGYFLGFHC